MLGPTSAVWQVLCQAQHNTIPAVACLLWPSKRRRVARLLPWSLVSLLPCSIWPQCVLRSWSLPCPRNWFARSIQGTAQHLTNAPRDKALLPLQRRNSHGSGVGRFRRACWRLPELFSHAGSLVRDHWRSRAVPGPKSSDEPLLASPRPTTKCNIRPESQQPATLCARTNAGRSTQRRPHIRLCSRSLAWKLGAPHDADAQVTHIGSGGVGERAREGEPPSAHTADQSQRKLKFDDRRQQFSSISVEVRIERKLSRAWNTWGSNWKNFTRGVTTPKSRKKSTRFRCRKQHRRPTDVLCYIRQV